MERRDVLRASGVTLAVALGGCAGERKSRMSSTTSKTTTTDEEPTITDEATTTNEASKTEETITTVGSAETQYNFGETHSHDHWKITVADFELMTTFQTDDGGTYDMPKYKQLGVATIEVTNHASEEQMWAGMPFGAIFQRRGYEDKRGFKHPEFSGYVSMDDLKRIDHSRQYAPEAYPIESSERVTLWTLFILPSDAIRDRVSVGFDAKPSDESVYPVRWTLS